MRAELTKHHTQAGRGKYASAALWVTIILLSTGGFAQQQTFEHRDANGAVTFSDAPVENGQVMRSSYKAFIREPVAANPCRGLTQADLDARGAGLDVWFARAQLVYGVDASLLKAVARAESCFDANAVSTAGAKGLMQLMPPTASAMDVVDIFDAEQNLAGGARYLAAMLARYSHDLDLALAAYNAGPGNVDRYHGIPPFRETERYIKSVKAFQTRYEQLQTTAVQAASAD